MIEGAIRRHTEVLPELVALAGSRALDVGCGSGGLVRWLRRRGAVAFGLDRAAALPGSADLAPELAGRLIAGSGEGLPFGSATLDLVLYLNSLHHLPESAMARAVREAGRVLRVGGSLVVIEPVAEGPYFELLRPVEDETEVRRLAQAALAAAETTGYWRGSHQTGYTMTIQADSADAVCRRFLAADAARAPAIARAREAIEHRFERLGTPAEGGGRLFLQPFRLCQLERAAEPPLLIGEVADTPALRACLAIRRAVFVAEQGVPPEDEFDALESHCTHLLARADGQPVATLRWRPYDEGTVKIERVAVVRQARGRGIGDRLMRNCLARLDQEVATTVLSAQAQVRAFYERLGYAAEGEPYLEDGLLHIRMRRERPL